MGNSGVRSARVRSRSRARVPLWSLLACLAVLIPITAVGQSLPPETPEALEAEKTGVDFTDVLSTRTPVPGTNGEVRYRFERDRDRQERGRAMLSQAIQEAINNQINAELYSAYLYLAMSGQCAAANLPGFARWPRIQSREELGHAMRFFDYVVDRGGCPTLQAIGQPSAVFMGPLDLFQQTLTHEQGVTKRIHQLYGLAATENDYATQEMLQWFIKEQVEEDRSASEVLETLKMAGEQGPALILLDRQLGARQAGD